MDYNPQKLSPENYDAENGCRLLTVEEFAILSDKVSLLTPIGRGLMERLAPSFWHQGACQWVPADPTKTLSESLSYRTQAPLPEFVPREFDLAFEAACGDFVESWNYLATYHHELMKDKGFWDGENSVIACLQEHAPGLVPIAIAAFDGQKIALVTSESSEKLEAIRHGNQPDDKIPEFTGAEAEGADELLRIMDHSRGRKWLIAEAFVAKMKMNATRAKMHGGKQF
jgi:hypothetical protein